MNGISKWLLGVIAAALITAIINTLLPKNSKNAKIIGIISGFFILLTALTPLSGDRILDFNIFIEDIEKSGQAAAQSGHESSASQMRQIITAQTEAYIQEKATAMGADIQVTVTLSTDDPPIPVAVKLEGSITPYDRSKLAAIIANDIGVTEDQQTWI